MSSLPPRRSPGRRTAAMPVPTRVDPLAGQAADARADRQKRRAWLGQPRRYMRAAPNPRLSPGGLGPHLTSSGSRAGFPPVSLRLPTGFFPVARLLLVTRRPAFSGSVPSAVAVRSGSPSVTPRVPFSFSNLHVSAFTGGARGRWSRPAGTKVPGFRRDARPRSRRPARNTGPGQDRVAARGPSPLTLRLCGNRGSRGRGPPSREAHASRLPLTGF